MVSPYKILPLTGTFLLLLLTATYAGISRLPQPEFLASPPPAMLAQANHLVTAPFDEPAFSRKDRDLLVLNAFNEARGESAAGIRAVLGVTIARLESACYPDTLQEVIYQPYQFSWTHQRGTAKTVAAAAKRDPAAFARIEEIVDDYLENGAKPSRCLLYHTRAVSPAWAKAQGIRRTQVVGDHIFYSQSRC